MTAVQQIQRRNEKAQNLRVIQADETSYYVESEEGKICYKVSYQDGKENYCTCGDFVKQSKTDPQFKCKHILAIINSEHDFEKAQYLEKSRPKLDERFITIIEGQEFVKYAGLLDLAHQKKLCKLDVEILQYPTKDNEKTAICKALAQTAMGDVFVDIGDACPMNCNARVAKHIIRMSSTRAKARALRDLTNIGMTCLEELGDLDEVLGGEEKGTARKGKVSSFPKKILKTETNSGNGNGGKTRAADPSGKVSDVSSSKEVKETPKEVEKDEKKTTTDSQSEAKGPEKSEGNGKGKTKTDIPPVMSEAQKRAIYNLSRRRGISVEELEKMCQETYKAPLEKLTPSDARAFIRNLQQSA